MKKEYTKPTMLVITVNNRTSLLTSSPATGDIPLGAPELVFDDDDVE